jgi:AcrR family transcriptional regulator
MTLLPAPDRVGADEPSTIERIRSAALKSFATHGTSATSLRSVAAAAGVSLGLVQHHFGTKAGLIKAVDDHVTAIMFGTMAQPVSEPDTVAEMGTRVTRMLSEQPDIVDYVGRTLVDGSPTGSMIFDSLVAFGTARWNRRYEHGETRPDIDLTWAALNSLMLALSAFILRSHIERQLPEPLTTPTQLQRWHDAVNTLLREGLFRRAVDDGAVGS